MSEEYNVVLDKLHDYMFEENNMKRSLTLKLNSYINSDIKKKYN